MVSTAGKTGSDVGRTTADRLNMGRDATIPGHAGTTVLIADDNADLRELLAHQVRKIGARVMLAANGQEAVDLALSHRPELVVMDLEMPVMSGLDAAATLRRGGYAGVILAFTAHEDGPRTEGALANGCNAVLKKPLSATKLRMRLAEYLGSRVSGSAA